MAHHDPASCAACCCSRLILQIIGTAQVFLEPFLFTSGGPANSTLTVLLLIYDYAFGNSLGGDYGNGNGPEPDDSPRSSRCSRWCTCA